MVLSICGIIPCPVGFITSVRKARTSPDY
jgi:hypothetical protein